MTVIVAKVGMQDGPVTEVGLARFAQLARDEGWGLVEEPDLVALMLRRPRCPDLVVLGADALANGMENVRAARNSFPTAGVVLWCRVGMPEYVAAALQAGADDVVGDWMLGTELVARIRRLVQPRRQPPRTSTAVLGHLDRACWHQRSEGPPGAGLRAVRSRRLGRWSSAGLWQRTPPSWALSKSRGPFHEDRRPDCRRRGW